MSVALNQLGMVEMASYIRDGRATSLSIMEACLERIARREKQVGAFSNLNEEAALSAARRADQSKQKGQLHGVPFGIKDIIDPPPIL